MDSCGHKRTAQDVVTFAEILRRRTEAARNIIRAARSERGEFGELRTFSCAPELAADLWATWHTADRIEPLVEVDTEATCSAIFRVLRAPDETERGAAIIALGQLVAQQAQDYILLRHESDNEAVREEA